MADDRVARIVRIAIVVLIALAAVYTAFWLLSGWYFEDKAQSAKMPVDTVAMGQVRFAFGCLALAVAAASIGISFSPRIIGHAVCGLLGLWSVIAGILALARGLTPVLGVSFTVGGGVMIALAYFSFVNRSRAAWAFLTAMCVVFGLAELFGAPKTAIQLGVSLWTALIFPGLYTVLAIGMFMIRDEYRDA